jgi:transglutaminase/protease-like cytokinesis protein 3
MTKYKPDEITVSINGEEIKGMKNPSFMSEDIYTITIEREWNDIYVTVKDSSGNEIGEKERIAILKDILPRVIESLS